MKKTHWSSRLLAMLMCLALTLGSFAGVVSAAEEGKIYADFATFEEEQAAAEKLAEEIGGEGMVLLKNNGTLPLSGAYKNVTLFGYGSYATVTGGGGSGAASDSKYQTPDTIISSLEDSGFQINPTVKSYYEGLKNGGTTGNSGWETASLPYANLVFDPDCMESAEGSYVYYNDAAIITISREGSEGSDKSTTTFDNGKTGADYAGTKYEGVDSHSLELFPEELELVEHVKANFDTVIVLVNTSNALELAVLEDDPAIDAVLWIGNPGTSGLANLGEILRGEVNPSGRLVDVYDADHTQDPTWYNFADNAQTGGTASIYRLETAADVAGEAAAPATEGTEGTEGTEDSEGGETTDGGSEGGASDTATGEDSDGGEDSEGGETTDAPAEGAEGESEGGETTGAPAEGGETAGDNIVEMIDSSSDMQSGSSARAQIEYEEGIYLGYKWYETASTISGYYKADENSYAPGTNRTVKDAYYNRTNGVVYPFGFGMSYTTFDWEIVSSGSKTLDAKTIVSIQVKVTNTGDYAGKDVVQVYYNPPYYAGGIEKAAANLITFGKTDLLQPGESQVLTLEFNAKDMASFDWNDANGNGFLGYELEAGSYIVSLNTDSHTIKSGCSLTYKVNSDIKYDGSSAKYNWNEEGEVSTGKANAEAIFSDPDSYYYSASPKGEYASNVQYVSRTNWALPIAPTKETSIISAEDVTNILYQEGYKTTQDNESQPWYVAEDGIPATWTQAVEAASKADTIQIQTLIGVEYDIDIVDGKVVQGDDEGTKAWETFMNQFTLAELKTYLSLDWQLASIDRAGIDKVSANDGPARLLSGTFWPCCTMIASTWNTDLAYQQGRMVGNEGLFQNCNVWYGPGANIHRSAFTGRNFEYYSSCGVQAGIIAAAVVGGCIDMGVTPALKHCALNDQETNRQNNDGLIVWCNEQAMREIYFKPFEMSVTDGDGVCFMQSYTRIGTVGFDNNYMFQVVVCEDEWDMGGMFYSDMGGANNADYHLRTGATHGINSYSSAISGTWNEAGYVEIDGVQSNTQYAAIRLAAMQWMQTALNQANNRNLVNTEAFTSKSGATYEAINGVAFSQSIGCTLEELNAFEAYYIIIDGALPAGLTLGADGTISGTPEESGTFQVTVSMVADRYVTTVDRVNDRSDASTGYYSTDAIFTIKVVPAFELAAASWIADSESEAAITSEKVYVDETNIESISYTIVDGPAWLNVAEDGVLYGTPDAAGTYSVTMKMVAKSYATEDSSGGSSFTSTTYEETFSIVVAAASVQTNDPQPTNPQPTEPQATQPQATEPAGTTEQPAADMTGIIGIILGAAALVVALLGKKKN